MARIDALLTPRLLVMPSRSGYPRCRAFSAEPGGFQKPESTLLKEDQGMIKDLPGAVSKSRQYMCNCC